jgi:hypothetical protein
MYFLYVYLLCIVILIYYYALYTDILHNKSNILCKTSKMELKNELYILRSLDEGTNVDRS